MLEISFWDILKISLLGSVIVGVAAKALDVVLDTSKKKANNVFIVTTEEKGNKKEAKK